jgi:hypothetical protein
MTNRSEPPRSGDTTDDPRVWWARRVGSGPDQDWNWTDRRRIPWLGIFLVMLGAALLIQQLDPRISFGSLLLLALGLAFGAAWLVGRSRWAALPGLILLALAGARLGSELRLLVGDGWTPLLLGAALLIAWGIGRLQGARREWALWIGLLLALVGLAQISDQLPDLLDVGPLWALVILVAGILLILGRRLPSLGREP